MTSLDDKQKPARTQDDYIEMTHSVLLNHLKTEVNKSKHRTRLNRITDYLTKRVWSWFYYYVTSRFGPNYPYPTYTGADTGIYPLGPRSASIALTADWATNTPESLQVAQKMDSHNPDYTIHLGDTYFVGAPPEINDNFIKHGSPWVRGSKGSFAILGNHEMYARGVAFFKTLLPTLGLITAAHKFDGQKAGFFCLENDHWCVLGLDTGYHSIGKVPILELLPWFSPDCHFDEKLITWLEQYFKLDAKNSKKGLVILTHHQYITAFNKQGEYTKPADQLATVIGKDRPVIWLWGHEHKMTIFEKAQVGEGVTAYGRCIGHGGMPVELEAKEFQRSADKKGYSKLISVDERTRVNKPGCHLGFNGYVLLNIDDENLEIGYYDVIGMILTEKWVADINTGKIKGSIKNSDVHGLTPEPGRSWQDAVS